MCVFEIILRIFFGLMAVVWCISHFVYLKIGKLAKMYAILTAFMIVLGLTDCILAAIGF